MILALRALAVAAHALLGLVTVIVVPAALGVLALGVCAWVGCLWLKEKVPPRKRWVPPMGF